MDSYGNYIEDKKDSLLLFDQEKDPRLMHPMVSKPDTSLMHPRPSPVVGEGGIPQPPSESVNLGSSLSDAQQNIFCTGLGFSVGFEGSADAGQLSAGAGLEYGFGLSAVSAENYEEGFYYGICGSGSFGPESDVPTDTGTAERKTKNGADVGVSFSATAGFWHSTSALPGFGESYEVSFQHWIFQGLVLSRLLSFLP